jgi:hypothetical protein
MGVPGPGGAVEQLQALEDVCGPPEPQTRVRGAPSKHTFRASAGHDFQVDSGVAASQNQAAHGATCRCAVCLSQHKHCSVLEGTAGRARRHEHVRLRRPLQRAGVCLDCGGHLVANRLQRMSLQGSQEVTVNYKTFLVSTGREFKRGMSGMRAAGGRMRKL